MLIYNVGKILPELDLLQKQLELQPFLLQMNYTKMHTISIFIPEISLMWLTFVIYLARH